MLIRPRDARRALSIDSSLSSDNLVEEAATSSTLLANPVSTLSTRSSSTALKGSRGSSSRSRSRQQRSIDANFSTTIVRLVNTVSDYIPNRQEEAE